MVERKEYVTEKGTHLYYRVFYDLGGLNYFTYKNTARGYYLEIRRNPVQMSAFSSLTDKDGAIKYLLIEVSRKSAKQQKLAEDMAEETIKHIVKIYNERGFEI